MGLNPIAMAAIMSNARGFIANYKPKGTFETYENISTYVSGDKASKKAIVVVMDIFGMVPLTQQVSNFHPGGKWNSTDICDLIGLRYTRKPRLLRHNA